MQVDGVQNQFIERFTASAQGVVLKYDDSQTGVGQTIDHFSHYELLKNMKSYLPKLYNELDNLATIIATELKVVVTEELHTKVNKITLKALQQIAVSQFKVQASA